MIQGATSGEVVLDVRDVALRLAGALVLDGVTFSLVDRIREGATTGQIASVLGPSGVGKTRLLRLLAGLDAPSCGSIRGYRGRAIDTSQVGLVFQDYPLIHHRTVLGNLELAGRIGGLGARAGRERAAELLALVGLSERADYYPAELSGGQRQRAAIAQQMMVPRPLLLLDEPFSGLDPGALREVQRLIVEVANLHELNTVVLVTHDVRAALTVSDTLVLLGRGRDRRSGAHVEATMDLVDLGVAWEQGEGSSVRRELERELEARFQGC